uniref:MARVEL domain-containing protein n=1 Tax=Parascaris univalens TaxID=6257 RepID=A0A915ABZ4_PARUN
MTLVRGFLSTSSHFTEGRYYVCGRVHPQPASFIVSFISFTSFLFVTVFFIYAGYWYALPVLIVGSVGWIVCLTFLLSRTVMPFIILLALLHICLDMLTALFIYFAITATGPYIFSQDVWNDKSGNVHIVYSPKRAEISNGIVAGVFAALAILIAYCAYVMHQFKKYIRELVSTRSQRDSSGTRQCDYGNRLPIDISGHLNPCYADMIQIGGQNRSSYGSPPSYDALAFGMPVVPPAYTSDETSLPSYSATVSSPHTGNTNAADSILSTSRNDQMPKMDVLVEGQK